MLRTPLFRFVVRLLGALVVTLGLWWMALLGPMLEGMRWATEIAMKCLPGDGSAAHATIQPDGGWILQMPVPAWVGKLDSTQQVFGRTDSKAPPVTVRSLRVPVVAKYPALFTVSLPFFLALWAAAPGKGNLLRGLLPGSIALAILGVLSLVFQGVYAAATTLHLTSGGMSAFLFTTTSFAIVDLVPHATPVLLALWLHPGLQDLVFSGKEAAPEPEKPQVKAARSGRGRYR
jgi:hypothetical protein